VALNPSGMASPVVATVPQGKGYNTRISLIFPKLSDNLTSSYIEVRDP
jgi:hypothetical protein